MYKLTLNKIIFSLICLFYTVGINAANYGGMVESQTSTQSPYCLKDHSIGSMVDTFIDLYFEPGQQKHQLTPLIVWATRFASYRAPGLWEEVKRGEPYSWISISNSINSLNKHFLRMVTYADKNFVDRETTLKITFIPPGDEIRPTKLKSYKPLTDDQKKRMKRFMVSSRNCELWQDNMIILEKEWDRVNIYIKPFFGNTNTLRYEVDMGSCYTRSILNYMGFQNKEDLSKAGLIGLNRYDKPMFTKFTKWLILTRLELEKVSFKKGGGFISRDQVRSDLTRSFNNKCDTASN